MAIALSVSIDPRIARQDVPEIIARPRSPRQTVVDVQAFPVQSPPCSDTVHTPLLHDRDRRLAGKCDITTGLVPEHRTHYRGGIKITPLAVGITLHQTHPFGDERRLDPGVVMHQGAPKMQRHSQLLEQRPLNS